jgi:hypothetical protein
MRQAFHSSSGRGRRDRTRSAQATMTNNAPRRHKAARIRRRQVHIWLSHHDYEWLKEESRERDESVSGVVKSLVRIHRSLRKRAS